jgi:hypothetical protein
MLASSANPQINIATAAATPSVMTMISPTPSGPSVMGGAEETVMFQQLTEYEACIYYLFHDNLYM